MIRLKEKDLVRVMNIEDEDGGLLNEEGYRDALLQVGEVQTLPRRGGDYYGIRMMIHGQFHLCHFYRRELRLVK